MADPDPTAPDSTRPEPIAPPSARPVVWFRGVVEPTAPRMAPNAPYLGLDSATRDVFIHASSLALDLLRVAEALGMDACVFANPSQVGTSDEAFVTINYLEQHQPEVFESYGLAELRQRVRAAYDRVRSDGGGSGGPLTGRRG